MHSQYERVNGLTHDVIGAGIEVHRTLGPGLLESIYERCLLHELELRGHTVLRQESVSVRYKEIVFEETLRLNLLIDGCLLAEVKCVQEVHPLEVPVGRPGAVDYHSVSAAAAFLSISQ